MTSYYSIKNSLLLLVFTTYSVTAMSQRIEGKGKAAMDSAFWVKVSSYHCSGSWFLTLNVKKECDEYIAEWRTDYGGLAINKPDSARVILTQQQVVELNGFAQRLSPKVEHKENCRGTTYVEFRSESLQNKQRFCDCSATNLGEVFSITKNPKADSVQHQL